MSTDMWKRENTKLCQVRLVKSDDLYKALVCATQAEKMAEGAYIRQALIEKLIRDGYLQGGSEPK